MAKAAKTIVTLEGSLKDGVTYIVALLTIDLLQDPMYVNGTLLLSSSSPAPHTPEPRRSSLNRPSTAKVSDPTTRFRDSGTRTGVPDSSSVMLGATTGALWIGAVLALTAIM